MMADEFDNVTPLRGRGMDASAKRFFDSFAPAGEIEADLNRPYLIKGWFDKGMVSVLYGPSNVGKTFLALDIAHAVSSGKSWGGCRVRQAPVMYVAAEGGAGINARIAALDSPQFWLCPLDVSFQNHEGDATALAGAINEMEATHGPFGMIIIDTVAKAMSGADENSSVDMGHFIKCIETLKAKTTAHIMLVHHTGKDSGKGARGHSSLRAAVDTEIELTKEDSNPVIEAKATKQRDMETGKVFAYRLQEVNLGTDEDGDPVTTCVVEPDEAGQASKKIYVKGAEKVALDALIDVISLTGQKRTSADKGEMSVEIYPPTKCVRLEEWADMCIRKSLSASEDKESQSRAFRRVRESLRNKGLVDVVDGLVWKLHQ